MGRINPTIPHLRVIIALEPAALTVSIAAAAILDATILTARAAKFFTDPFEKIAATAAAVPDLFFGLLPIVAAVSAFHDEQVPKETDQEWENHP